MLWALLLVIPAGIAHAAGTFYVDNTNPNASDTGPGTLAVPYRSISAADRMRGGPGTTLIVMPGVYHEQVTVFASGSAVSPYVIRAGGDNTLLDGAEDFTNPSRWALATGDTWLAASVLWPTTHVYANGVRLSVTTAPPESMAVGTFQWVFGTGLYVNVGGDNPAGHDLRVGFHPNAFRITSRQYVTVRGFDVTRTEEHGIYSLQSSNITIEKNHATFTGAHGIAIQGGTAVMVDSNTVSDAADHGINILSGVTNSTVQDNESFRNARVFERAANGLMVFNSTNILIQRNRFHDNEDSGLDFTNGSDNNVSIQNLSWSNGDHGFDQIESVNIQHIGDVAYGNTNEGFSIEGGATGAQLWNCISVNNGLATGHFDVYVDTSSTAGFQSNYNIIWNSTTNKPFKYNGVQYATVAAFSAVTGTDGATFQADPRFVNPGISDYHLQSGSKAIDSGTSSVANWPLTDFEGNARIDDAQTPNTGVGPVTFADRGAFEFKRTGSVAVDDVHAGFVALGPAFPNPGRGAVSFSLQLERAGVVTWTVTDVLGRRVHQDAGAFNAGRATIRWSGAGVQGKEVPAGIYVIRLDANGETLTRHFTVVR